MPRNYTPRVPRCCLVCGAVFTVKASDLTYGYGRGKYCGNACRFVAQRGRRTPLFERWWRYVTPEPSPLACWPWRGKSISKDGYGRLTVRRADGSKHDLLATRVGWEMVAGAIPAGMFVCHACDNPICVRNDDAGSYEINGVLRPRRGHLWLGTPSDNMMDMAFKGRVPRADTHWHRLRPDLVPRGERAGLAKLTDDAVREIRRRYAAGHVIQRQLAEEFGVNQTQISNVVLGRTWKHVR